MHIVHEDVDDDKSFENTQKPGKCEYFQFDKIKHNKLV